MKKSNSIQITVYEAKADLLRYLSDVEKGRKVIIGRFGKPEFEIIKLKHSSTKGLKKRKAIFGSLKDQIRISFLEGFNESDVEVAKLFGFSL